MKLFLLCCVVLKTHTCTSMLHTGTCIIKEESDLMQYMYRFLREG